VDILTIFGVLFDGDFASTCHGHKNYKETYFQGMWKPKQTMTKVGLIWL
jgi:hypothetical protein